MNYEKMWYMLKKDMRTISRDNRLGEEKKEAARVCLDAMNDVEIMFSGRPEPEVKVIDTPNIKKHSYNQTTQSNEDSGKKVLKKIFGEDLVGDIRTLERKLKGTKEKVIMVDGDMDVPECLEKEAAERNIMLVRAHCQEIKAGSTPQMPFPFIFPPGFLK